MNRRDADSSIDHNTAAQGREPGSSDAATPSPPWLSLYLWLQFELDTLSSVAIEVPALRPAADALREALGD